MIKHSKEKVNIKLYVHSLIGAFVCLIKHPNDSVRGCNEVSISCDTLPGLQHVGIPPGHPSHQDALIGGTSGRRNRELCVFLGYLIRIIV